MKLVTTKYFKLIFAASFSALISLPLGAQPEEGSPNEKVLAEISLSAKEMVPALANLVPKTASDERLLTFFKDIGSFLARVGQKNFAPSNELIDETKNTVSDLKIAVKFFKDFKLEPQDLANKILVEDKAKSIILASEKIIDEGEDNENGNFSTAFEKLLTKVAESKAKLFTALGLSSLANTLWAQKEAEDAILKAQSSIAPAENARAEQRKQMSAIKKYLADGPALVVSNKNLLDKKLEAMTKNLELIIKALFAEINLDSIKDQQALKAELDQKLKDINETPAVKALQDLIQKEIATLDSRIDKAQTVNDFVNSEVTSAVSQILYGAASGWAMSAGNPAGALTGAAVAAAKIAANKLFEYFTGG